MMDRAAAYDLIYALAARNGRERALFGDSAPRAREAFGRGLCSCEAFPELWLELPLAGDAWFDLHMLAHRRDMREGVTFAGLGGAYADALTWFSRARNARQLALSFDTGTGNATTPAVQVLVDNRDVTTGEGFLAAVGRADLAPAFRAFAERIPQEWYACYQGVFPARAGDGRGDWLRVECLVGEGCQRAYANDASVLRDHLARVGLEEFDGATIPRIQGLARSRYPLELQFDVGPSGMALPVLSASLRIGPADWRAPDVPGGANEPFAQAQAWGLADDRWRELAGTAYAQRVTQGGEAEVIYCYPAFVKLRWRAGMGADAKAYLRAGVK